MSHTNSTAPPGLPVTERTMAVPIPTYPLPRVRFPAVTPKHRGAPLASRLSLPKAVPGALCLVHSLQHICESYLEPIHSLSLIFLSTIPNNLFETTVSSTTQSAYTRQSIFA
ncbi:unnamed protein product [Zymoseptoria tritici ST99CH_3D7]|uniref:Uncharacterized protein n=1 Tax=Zymoseptoria tritici (strain ST99CH_3D7) TaxID=1276538 RepID=A0A1X7S1D8_ZYMT9|nr:unnamed protein product [Zymoseptoria tritici ST99CH_3D7]